MVETLRAQLLDQFARGHQGGVGAVVETAQPREHPRREEAGSIAAHVVVETGVEAGGHGDPQPLRRAQCGPAQRAFGGDVDRVRTIAHPARGKLAARRQPEAHAGVSGDRRPVDAQQLGRFIAVLAWPRGADEADVVSERRQPIVQGLHGQGHAVDFRRVGLGDELEAAGEGGSRVHAASLKGVRGRAVTWR